MSEQKKKIKKQTNNKKENKDFKNNNKPKKVKKEVKENWEKKYKESEKLNAQLQMKIFELSVENRKNIDDFQKKAKEFQGKAGKQVNELEKKLIEKFDQDTKDIKKYGSQSFLEGITPILFNIDMAIKAGKNQEGAVSAYVMGFEMLLNQIYEVYKNNGAKIIDPKIGEEYNPEIHQASKVEDNGNKIISVNKKGLKLFERVLIPASVVVGK